MPSEQAAPARRRRHRSAGACDFCRRRKLGCDNSRPKCENCTSRGVECTYARRTKTARPSNARISRLEEENARLRSSLRQSSQPNIQDGAIELTPPTLDEPSLICQDATPSQNITQISQGTPALLQDSSLPPSPTPLQRQPPIHQQEVAFHGPASVMFDATPRKENTVDFDMSTSHARNKLLADATRQRQLEVVNLHSGKLDFDGVDADLGMRLLAFFWNRQHYSGTVVYRPVFMRDMASKGPYFSKLLLNAIYFSASKNLPASEYKNHDNGRSFRRKFEAHLNEPGGQVLWKSSVTTIQALLIVADALFTWCDERTLAWHYMGVAINMIVDLGIHVEGSSTRPAKSRSPEDIEVHRRLFWASFILDKVQSIYQGRPARLREIDNRVPVEFLDEYEELELFHTLTYSAEPALLDRPAYSVSTFRELCKLSIIMDRILCKLYAEKSSSQDPVELFRTSRILQSELKRWRDSLPGYILVDLDNSDTSAPLPHTLSLLSMYNSLVILLNRPFVSDGHLQSVSASTASNAFSACTASALEIHNILLIYRNHFCMTTTPYFVSYATYVSATIHVRIAAQQRPDSEAHKRLQNCLYALGEQQSKCHGPRQAMRILKSLIRRLNVTVKEVPEIRFGNCQGTEIPSAASDSNAIVPADTQNNLDVSQYLAESQIISSGPMFTELDIDEVMRSFGYGFRYPLTPADAQGNSSHNTQISVSNMDTVGIRGFTEDMMASFEDAANYGLQETLFLDPLFGFDVSL